MEQPGGSPREQHNELTSLIRFLAAFGGMLLGGGVVYGLVEQDPTGGLVLPAMGVLVLLVGLSLTHKSLQSQFALWSLTWLVLAAMDPLTQSWGWSFWQQVVAFFVGLGVLGGAWGLLQWAYKRFRKTREAQLPR
ncbi:MAG: hypothetical protein M3P51_10035 [Chloroflexota bacterium]|nr:hypothetical protein [Chloroflexota bacterium]